MLESCDEISPPSELAGTRDPQSGHTCGKSVQAFTWDNWIAIDFVNSPIDKEIKTLITRLYPHLLCRVVSFFGGL